MGYLEVGLDLLGIGVEAYGQYKQGQDAKDVYEYNQAIAEYQAGYIRDAAQIDLEALGRKVGDVVSRKRAIQGKSGTVANTGSNAGAIERIYNEGEIDAAIIRWNADKRYDLAKKGANLLGTQADQFSFAGSFNAGTTLLGGLSKWDFKKSPEPFKATGASGRFNVGQFGTTAYGI
jgi:hypothetical protein